MKIIQLIYSLCSGGAEKFVVNLSNEMAEQGHDIMICMLLKDSNPRYVFNKINLSSKVKFCSLNLDQGFSFKKVMLVEAFMKEHKPDIVHCHLNVIPYIYRLSFLNRNIKFIHTVHNIASKASGLRIQYFINKYFYKKKLIQPVTISKVCNRSFLEFYRLEHAICIDNGCPRIIPSEFFSEVCAEVETYKANVDTPVFIHIARCHPQKNQQLLLDVFNKLSYEGFDYVLLVIGSGFFDEQNKALFQKQSDNIHFLGEKKNVGDYLLCGNAFCLTSIYEGLPISLLEAMSCGIPSICTPVGGIPDVVIDGVTGFLSKDMKAQSYVNVIIKFLENTIDNKKIMDEYERRFSILECVKKYMSVYKSI